MVGVAQLADALGGDVGLDVLARLGKLPECLAAIAEAGRNPYYTALTLRLLDEGRRILRLYYQSFNDRLPKEYSDEHEGIINAIAARDVELCDRLAREHADQIVRQIKQFFSRDMRQDVRL